MPNCTGDTYCNACGKHWDDGPCFMPEGWAMTVDWHGNPELSRAQAEAAGLDNHTEWRRLNEPDQR